MTPEEEEDQLVKDLTHLRTLPAFQRAVLAPLRDEFLDQIYELANASPDEVEKIRGVVSFIATSYHGLSGQPITDPGQQDKGNEAGPA